MIIGKTVTYCKMQAEIIDENETHVVLRFEDGSQLTTLKINYMDGSNGTQTMETSNELSRRK